MTLRLGGEPLGLGLGVGDDRLGLALGLALLALVFGEQLAGLVAQAAGLVELGLDAGAALVERVDDLLVDADIDQHAEEEHEGDGDPEFGSLIMSIAELLPLQRVGDRGLDRAAGRRRADQPLDDGRGGVDRDAADVGHGGGLGRGDGLLGLGELGVELGLRAPCGPPRPRR